jgi:glutamate dehydrogenase (NADP+)
LVRPEATGYGTMYFAKAMLEAKGEQMEGKDSFGQRLRQCCLGAAVKATQLGAKVVTISGPMLYL